MTARHSSLLLLLALVAVLTGCGRYSGSAVEQSDQPPAAVETVWVDPEIVFSDSLVTLIRSDRVDSIAADPSATANHRSPSVEVFVYEPACNVAVSILDAELRLVHPLMIRTLKTGFYKLTVTPRSFRPLPLRPGEYFLHADYCGRTKSVLFRVD